MRYLYIFAVVIAALLVYLYCKIRRENERRPIWMSDPEKELMLHNTSAREKTWGGESSDWQQTLEKQPRQENEK